MARVGYSRASFYFYSYVPESVQAETPAVRAGVPTYAVVIAGSTASNGASSITTAGANVGSNNGIARNLFTLDDHAYTTMGKHSLQGGVWVQRLQSNDNLAQDQYGQASFASLSTFLAGNIKTFTYAPQTTELGWRTLFATAFLEDTYHFTPRLEVRAGFRSESSTGWSEAQGRAAVYSFTNGVISTNPSVQGNARINQNQCAVSAGAAAGFGVECVWQWTDECNSGSLGCTIRFWTRWTTVWIRRRRSTPSIAMRAQR